MAQAPVVKPPAKIPPSTAKYTTHLPSIEAMRTFVANFSFQDPMQQHKFFILLSSLPKLGKTHFACTMTETEPCYLLDTEFKGAEVARKFLATGNMFYREIHSFVEMAAAVRVITGAKNSDGTLKYPKGTIILDSGSDLQLFAEDLYLLETGKEVVGGPRYWAEVFGKCNALINEVKAAGFNLILTTRMKEEYRQNAATGRMVPRIWENALYLSDIAVEWNEQGIAMVKLNAYKRQSEPIPMTATTIGELVAQSKEQQLAPPQTKAA